MLSIMQHQQEILRASGADEVVAYLREGAVANSEKTAANMFAHYRDRLLVEPFTVVAIESLEDGGYDVEPLIGVAEIEKGPTLGDALRLPPPDRVPSNMTVSDVNFLVGWIMVAEGVERRLIELVGLAKQ
jgi:hypothetical protein